MSQAHHQELVPLAERPNYEPEDPRETVWYNPQEQDQVLELYVGQPTPIFGGDPSRRPRLRPDERRGVRTYVIRAGQRRAIPSEFDYAIQQTMCKETECAGRPLYCQDRSHRKVIMGGLGPRLINEGMQHRPVLHPALDAEMAAYNEAMATAQKAADAAAALAQASRLSQGHAESLEARLTEPNAPPKTNASGGAASPKKEK